MFKVPDHIKVLLKELSTQPGIYKMLDKDKQVIYVGKAKNLRKRVKSYFQTKKDLSPKVAVMREKIVTIECTITRSELEALVLETNLIKSMRPRYNILMKDDKSYVYVKISREEDFPEINIVRRFERNSKFHYFGPYTSRDTIFKTLKGLQKMFPFRTCEGEIREEVPGQNVYQHLSRRAPCLEYYIKRCQAPCISKVTKTEYQQNIQAISNILKGNYDELIQDWQSTMQQAVNDKAFEIAARYRDRLQALQELSKKQYATLTSGHNQDVLAVAKDADQAVIALFMVRQGHVIQTEHFNLSDYSKDHNEEQLLSAFIEQYYSEAASLPDEVVVSTDFSPENKKLLEQFLSTIRDKKVGILMPERGEKRQLIDMVTENAQLQLENNKKNWQKEQTHSSQAIVTLQQALGMKTPPHRIECYDISHIQGTNKTGSMIVFIDGKPESKLYRRFHIESLAEGVNNDFASLQEVLTRRIRYLDELYRAKKKRRREKVDTMSLPERPDLIIIDGGKGQLSSVVKALKAEVKGGLKVELPLIISLAKREEEIFFPGKSIPLLLPKDTPVFFLIQRIRDEAHRFAIKGHRNLRSKKMVKSKLDTISGIGPKLKKKLLQAFGSVPGIREATFEDIVKVVGSKTAERIREML
ncbi:MAG: excinuclease ABC subunit UvrC [Candidatus Abawacabacteria bacterium]|nr:excinuclease ABC subunit UvrC [Candidatus Abawacabacteria bacterium]